MGWENIDEVAKTSLLETILYLKTGFVVPQYSNFLCKVNQYYLNIIKEIMVDVNIDNFKEKIIDSGKYDDEINKILFSEDALCSTLNMRFKRIIKKYEQSVEKGG